jgi:N-methylhydantoinase A
MLTTEGYRDTIEIGNELRYDTFDLFLTKPEPLAPRHLRKPIAGRLSAEGIELLPLDEQGIRQAVRDLLAEGVESIAVAFIHSYRNPAHEKAAQRIIEEEAPGVPVSLSCEVAPEIREYERFSTTLANAYVKPVVKAYLHRLEKRLREQAFTGSLYIVMSNGGVASLEEAAEFPVRIVESGPSCGAIAAAVVARQTKENNVIAFDMGGTTAKMALVHNAEPAQTFGFEAARIHRFKKGSGIPLRIPVIEMIEIGAGGGSIAWLDNMGLLKVGPRSASSVPGPVCYGLGGTKPTVTDADMTLGYLNPEHFLGGEMKLDVDGTHKVLEGVLGKPLGLNSVEAAAGIHEVVNNNMSTATRVYLAEQGGDPRKYALVATGGAGPVHAYGVARLLGLKKVIAPPASGIASALGMLLAPKMVTSAQSYVSRLDKIDWDHVTNLFSEAEARARKLLNAMGVAANAIKVECFADMRYAGQGYEVPVELSTEMLQSREAAPLADRFARAYEKAFGRALGGMPVETISWRLVASAPPDLKEVVFTRHYTDERPMQKGTRPVYFFEVKRYIETAVYDRYALKPGDRIPGPCVVEERESTVVAGPGSQVTVDPHLNLIIELG